MDNLFLALLLLSIVGFLVGVVRPQWIWMASRKRAAMIFAGAAVVFFTLFGFTSQRPLTPTTTAAIQSPSPATTSPEAFGATQATSSKVGGQCASAAAIAFADVETDYAKAYQDGKNALGSTQYADANAGLRALTIAGSAASKFSGWQKTWRAYEPKFYNLIVQGYNTASNCYSEHAVNEPASLASWRDDMAQLDADISAWVADATGWQIRETSGTKFSDDEAKVDTDFGMVQRDIDDLRNER